MFKSATAVMIAAVIAAAVTVLSAPTTPVTANPIPEAAAAPMHACIERAWPYLHCVGTRFGNPHIRLVSTDRLGAGEGRAGKIEERERQHGEGEDRHLHVTAPPERVMHDDFPFE